MKTSVQNFFPVQTLQLRMYSHASFLWLHRSHCCLIHKWDNGQYEGGKLCTLTRNLQISLQLKLANWVYIDMLLSSELTAHHCCLVHKRGNVQFEGGRGLRILIGKSPNLFCNVNFQTGVEMNYLLLNWHCCLIHEGDNPHWKKVALQCELADWVDIVLSLSWHLEGAMANLGGGREKLCTLKRNLEISWIKDISAKCRLIRELAISRENMFHWSKKSPNLHCNDRLTWFFPSDFTMTSLLSYPMRKTMADLRREEKEEKKCTLIRNLQISLQCKTFRLGIYWQVSFLWIWQLTTVVLSIGGQWPIRGGKRECAYSLTNLQTYFAVWIFKLRFEKMTTILLK